MRLIDADIIDKTLAEEAVFRIKQADRDYARAEARGLIKAREFVKQTPTVDAVPVVRCGECRGWEPEKRKEHKCDICRMFGFDTNDYCNHGKRKDDTHGNR